MADTIQVCPSASWMKAPIVGDPDQDFDPLADDFDGTKYAEEVGKKSVVGVAFLAVALAFLLFFLIWRCSRSMCILCCCKTHCDEKRTKNANLLWTKKALVLTIILVAVGLALIGLTSYGMFQLDVNVTDDGWNVIESNRDKLKEILDFADYMVSQLGGINAILDRLEVLIEKDVNATKIEEDLDCIDRTMATGLPDFGALQTNLTGLDTSLSTTLPGDVNALETSLKDLETDTINPMKAPVGDIVAAKATITTLQEDMRNYNDALTALPATHSPAADTAVANLKTAHAGLGDLSPHITKLQALSTALQTFADAVSTTPIDDVDTAITDITSTVDSMTRNLADVATDVRRLSTSFDEITPCFDSLMDRMVTINETVIGLPTDVESAISMLAAVTDAMNEVDGDPSLADLANQMDDLATTIDLPGDTGSFSSNLTTAKSNIQAVQSQVSAMRGEVNNIVTELQDVDTAMGGVKSQLDAYPNPGNSGAYTALLTVTDPMKPKVQNAVNALNDVTTNRAAAFTAVDDLDSMLPAVESNIAAQKGSLDSIDTELTAAPDMSGIVSSLDSVKATFDDLPSDVVNQPKDLVTTIDTNFGDTIGSVKESTKKSFDEVSTQIKDTRSDILGRIDDFEEDHKENTEKINERVYQATLVLYVFSILFAVCLVVFVALHFQFGVGLSIFLLLVIIFLYFMIAIILGTIMIMVNDSCHNMEKIVLNEVDEDSLPLVRYYLFNQGGPLRRILNETNTVDLDSVVDQATEAHDEIVNEIERDYVTKGKLKNILHDTANLTGSVVVLVDELEVKVSFENINPLYVQTKTYFCCKLPGVAHQVWRDLTYIGVLGLVLLFIGFISLQFLDMMPRVDCCGCTFRRKPSISSYDKVPDPASSPTKASASAPLIPDTPTREQIDTTLV